MASTNSILQRNATHKRKRHPSSDREHAAKRVDRSSTTTNSCFGRCCSRRKQNNKSIKEHQILTAINQYKSIDDFADKSKAKVQHPSISLQQSPWYNEYIFNKNVVSNVDDSCLECHVQYGPDTWENMLNNRSDSIDKVSVHDELLLTWTIYLARYLPTIG
jgi:Tfp pilus assembly protein PilW